MRLAKFKGSVFALFLFVSPYVLPYPGLMPGNKLYSLDQFFNRISQIWVFGNFASHKYELALSDKKLVEAKILFEYQQYPLALQALSASNDHFQRARSFLADAEKEGKNIDQKAKNFQEASQKHQEVLNNLERDLPEEFLWKPEKKEPQKLLIRQALEEAKKYSCLIN